MMSNLITQITNWENDSENLLSIRLEVFVKEQGVPLELEYDEYDKEATHFLVSTSNQINIATARLLADGHIGRMAVLPSYRKQNIGKNLLYSIIKFAHNRNMKYLPMTTRDPPRQPWDTLG